MGRTLERRRAPLETPYGAGDIMTDQERKTYFDIWSKAVDTQMHFNEMCVRSRQFGLAFVSAALGVAVVLLSQQKGFAFTLTVSGFTIIVHVASLIGFASAMAMYAVKKLDLGVYHQMLRGAVNFGEDFEENYMKKLFDLEKGMTQAISHFSRHTDANVSIKEGRATYTGESKTTAKDKIEEFYKLTICFLIGAGLLLLLFPNFNPSAYTTTLQ
jgi:hypothetical protein